MASSIKTQGPVLSFEPWDGKLPAFQARYVTVADDPVYRAAVKLTTADFKYDERIISETMTVSSIVAGFQVIEKDMPFELAKYLANSLPQAWGKIKHACSQINSGDPVADLHQALTASNKIFNPNDNNKLAFPYWFLLATSLGPGHPLLKTRRQKMTELWGVEFPSTAVIYPNNLSVQDQEKVFFGTVIRASNSDNINKLAQEFRHAIDNAPVADIARAVAAPKILANFRSTSELSDMASKAELDTTRKKLNEAQNQVNLLKKNQDWLKAENGKLRDELKNTRDEFKNTRDEMREQIKNLEKTVSKADERAEKSMAASTLALSILAAPGSDKRKRDDEA